MDLEAPHPLIQTSSPAAQCHITPTNSTNSSGSLVPSTEGTVHTILLATCLLVASKVNSFVCCVSKYNTSYLYSNTGFVHCWQKTKKTSTFIAGCLWGKKTYILSAYQSQFPPVYWLLTSHLNITPGGPPGQPYPAGHPQFSQAPPQVQMQLQQQAQIMQMRVSKGTSKKEWICYYHEQNIPSDYWYYLFMVQLISPLHYCYNWLSCHINQ